MKKILFVDACMRGKNSRTKKIAQCYINAAHNGATLTKRDLTAGGIKYLTVDSFDEKTGEKNDDSTKDLAEEFATADEIIIAAPFWEFVFPAALSCYIEAISIIGTTFEYTPKGSVGLCKANSLTYIYTAGDYLEESDKIGEHLFRRLCQMYGIKDFKSYYADGFDIIGNSPDKITNTLCEKIMRENR